MTTTDVYTTINDQNEAVIEKIIRRLEFRDDDPTFTTWREAYLDILPLSEAERVLDVGCGTGVVTRALARRPLDGRVTGVDYSPPLIAAARARADEADLPDIDFRVGDCHQLEFADADFDVVVLHTLISHAAEPEVVIREAARLLKPGGVMAIFDGDYASITFTHPDVLLAGEMEDAIIRAVVNNPRIMRKLPHLLHRSGLTLRHSQGHLLCEIGSGSFWLQAVETYVPMAVRANLVTNERASYWLSWQREASKMGAFFAASNYYTYIAEKNIAEQGR